MASNTDIVERYSLSRRELGTVLAALRAWQELADDERDAKGLSDIATDGNSFAPLSEKEIDHLCARLNDDDTAQS